MTTLHDMVTELETWTFFSAEEKRAAAESKITTENHAEFRDLVLNWGEGVYDEDPNCLANELTRLL